MAQGYGELFQHRQTRTYRFGERVCISYKAMVSWFINLADIFNYDLSCSSQVKSVHSKTVVKNPTGLLTTEPIIQRTNDT